MIENDNSLGAFLKDRRTKLDPASLGYPLTRRRTPGLRREEVAQRAQEVVDTGSLSCPEFQAIWQDHAVIESHEGVKTFENTATAENRTRVMALMQKE